MAESKEIQIIINAKNNADKALKQVEGSLKNLEPQIKKVSAVAAIGFAALTVAIGTSIKAYQESEKAEARLEQISKQVTKATDEQINSFKKLANELQKVGVVEDDVIKAGQSQIASFTKNADVVTILSDDLADLAVAQYGVNVSQDQAIQTANLMGKALSGQLGALTRTGILVNDEFKKAFENANNEQERAIILSQIIQDNYGGLNAKMRETSAGGLQALKNSFGDLQEIIGKNFIPILTKLVQTITPIIEKAGNWISTHEELFTKIVMVTGAILGIIAVLYPMITVFKTAAVVISALISPIGLVILAILALVTAGYLIIENWDKIKKAAQIFGEFIKNIWNGIKDFFTNIWNGIKEIFITSLNFLVGLVVSIFDLMGIDIIGILKKIKEFIIEFVNAIKDIFIGLFEVIKNIFNSVKEPLSKLWKNIWEAIKNVTMSWINAIKSPISSLIDWISNKFQFISNLVKNIIDKVKSIGGSMVSKGAEITGLAGGGEVEKGRTYLVGENGPELFTSGSGGNITPNNRLGGISINISNPMFLDKFAAEKFADLLMRQLKAQIRV